MNGTFTGAGVGPGDPELMTFKAARAIRECDAVAIPVSDKRLTRPVFEAVRQERNDDSASEACRAYLEKCVAYQIAAGAVPEIRMKDRLYLPMPMVKEKDRLKKIHDRDADAVQELLESGKDVVFLTLGDPSVYSTCMYVHRRLKARGYRTGLIPGVPSFCAAAARLDIPLVENRQELHLLPASYEIEESLRLPGTKVLMKAGRKMADVKRILKESGMQAAMVENCGMEKEQLFFSTEEIPEEAGYYSLLVVKEEKTEKGRTGA